MSFVRAIASIRLAALWLTLAGVAAAATGETMPAAAPPSIASPSARATPIVRGLATSGCIAVKPNGQACFVVDAGRSIIMIDPSEPTCRHVAVTPFPADEEVLAVACIDSITLGVVVRSGVRWSLRTYRLGPPGTPVEVGAPLQTVSLGEAPAGEQPLRVTLFVSHSRNWLAIAGLPSPLPPMLRGAIAGARVGAVGTRNCPERGRGDVRILPMAVAISPADELVVFDGAGLDDGRSRCVIHATLGGRRLLELDAGVPNVRAAVYAKDSLWVLAGSGSDARVPEGLWRLDAAVVDRRQAVRPVLLAALAAPRGLAALAESRLLVVHGDDGGTISQVELDPPTNAEE